MHIASYLRHLAVPATLATSLALAGCASSGNPKDPWESYNRVVYRFNTQVDDYLMKPVARGYNYLLPAVVRQGLGNVYNNVGEVRNIGNNLLQGKGEYAADSFARLLVNTTFGIAGLFDIMTPAGVPAREEDFGQTLAVWGVADGPYFVLPLLGPSTVRDTGGMGGDYVFGVIDNFDSIRARNAYTAARIVHKRSELLTATTLVDEAALDAYSFARDGYLQRRRFVIHDGNPPREYDPDDPESPEPAEK